MLIERVVFTAKPGQASKLAKLFKKAMSKLTKVRVMTDLVGEFNTVVMEMEVPSLAEYEKLMEKYQSGKMEEMLGPELMKEMASYTDLYQTGRREIYKIVE